jgi:hypothetical protein
MTNKEIAQRLRKDVSDHYDAVRLADELDPPRPKPKPRDPVWWRDIEGLTAWQLGMVVCGTHILTTDGERSQWLGVNEVQWKPARMLADDEVAVKAPPVEDWTPNATAIGLYMSYGDSGAVKLRDIITRAEAEAREAGR